jgi:hypothetical protein
MQNTIFIILGIIIILVFFFSISVIHIRALRDDINIRWYNLVDKLQYRQDLFPLLVETSRPFITEKKKQFEDMVEKTIEIRARAGMNSECSMNKIVVEHYFSRHLKEIIQFCETIDELRVNTGYLEVKKNIYDIEEEIKKLEKDYNDKVRNHNNVIARFYNIPAALTLRYGKKMIFEFE